MLSKLFLGLAYLTAALLLGSELAFIAAFFLRSYLRHAG